MDIGGNYKDATTPAFILPFPLIILVMISIILLSQNSDTILVRDTLEERRFATSQVLTTVAAFALLQGYIKPPQPSSSQCCFNIGTFVPPGCDFGNIIFGSCTGPTFDCATGGGDCSGGSSGGCSGGGSTGDCSGGSSGGCSGGGSSADCSGGSSASMDCSSSSSPTITCASPTPYFLPNKTSSIRYSQHSYSSKEPVPQAVLWCATFSPIACYIFTRITKYPIRKPMGVSSFAGALDGLIWGSLISANYYHYVNEWDPRIFYMFAIFGLSAGNLAGTLAGSFGGSEGAHILKTASAVQLPYAYNQLKRIIFARWAFDSTSEGELKADLGIITGLSIAGGLGTFTLTYNDHSITAGDALFMASNMIKGAFALEAPIKVLYATTRRDSNGAPVGTFFGYYNRDPVFERLGGFANLAGMALGGYISYKIVKKKDFSLTKGIAYAVVPLMYYPVLGSMESSFAPIMTTILDIGISIIIYL
jgi:hypothetical protein